VETKHLRVATYTAAIRPSNVVHRAIYPNHNADISVLRPSCNKQHIVSVVPLSQFIASGVHNSKYESVMTTS
jgi:hypothetical protein